MNERIEKRVDMLDTESVSIITRTVIDYKGNTLQVGENHRCAYVNSEKGRAALIEKEPEEVVNAVWAIWGDTPTVSEDVSEYE